VVAPLDLKPCISMNTCSFAEKCWQGLPLEETMLLELESRKSVVYWRRYGWSRCDGWNQKRWSTCLPNQPRLNENEKGIDSFANKRWATCLLTQPGFWKWKGFWLVCRIDLDSENANKPNDKETMCLPRRQQVYNRQAVWSPQDRLIDSTEWLNKGDDDRRICRSPPLNNELLLSTIDGGVDLLFCIFLVLKNA